MKWQTSFSTPFNKLSENKIPIKKAVADICEILGLEPMYVASEGKLLAFVKTEHTEKAHRIEELTEPFTMECKQYLLPLETQAEKNRRPKKSKN